MSEIFFFWELCLFLEAQMCKMACVICTRHPDGGLQLALIFLIFRKFRYFNVRFCARKFWDKNGKNVGDIHTQRQKKTLRHFSGKNIFRKWWSTLLACQLSKRLKWCHLRASGISSVMAPVHAGLCRYVFWGRTWFATLSHGTSWPSYRSACRFWSVNVLKGNASRFAIIWTY